MGFRSGKGEEGKMAKRLKRDNSIYSCSSPRLSSSFLNHRCCNLAWFDKDIWTEIAKYLGARCLVMLGSTNHWFHELIMEEETIWKFACLRDLEVPEPKHVSFKWKQLYASAFGGSHSYSYHQQDKHIDWMRIGAFFFDSPVSLLTDKLFTPVKIPLEESVEKMLQTTGSCIFNNVKTGIWIADLQLVRCPVCNLENCEGTMQTLDTRHIELFLNEEYTAGSWEYKEIGSHEVKKHADGATGAIFDVKHLKDPATKEVLDLKSWIAKPDDWQPKARISLHAVAANTNLQQNEGVNVRYHTMTAGPEGEVVSIRISQQLL